MMTSFPENIPILMAEICRMKGIVNVLDIGSGFGKYGLLVRELLLSRRAETTGELEPHDIYRIDCVETSAYFQNLPFHAALYNNHYHVSVFDLPPQQFALYHLILLIDVVEHHQKDVIISFLRQKIFAAGSPKVIISTPRKVEFYPQQFYGKGCPKHITQWDTADFVSLKGRFVDSKQSWIFIAEGCK